MRITIAWIVTGSGYAGGWRSGPEFRIAQRLAERHKRRKIEDRGLIGKRWGSELLRDRIRIRQGVVDPEACADGRFVVIEGTVSQTNARLEIAPGRIDQRSAN